MNEFKFPFRILKFTLSFLIISLGFCISGGYAQNAQEASAFLNSTPVISMDFKDADFKDILKAFSIQSGLNFIASQDLEDHTVTIYLDKVSVNEAMDKLFMASGVDYEYYEDSKIILVKKAEPEIKTITKVFQLKHARVSVSLIKDEMDNFLREGEDEDTEQKGGRASGGVESDAGITSLIRKLLSGEGSVVEDVRTNSIIVTDIPKRVIIIEEAIRELDVPVPQVMLEVEILDVSKDLVDDLGFDFSSNPLTLIFPGHGGRKSRFFLGDLDRKGIGIDHASAEGSVILGSTYAALLNFLSTHQETKYLARPRILTLNNETAEIKIETNELIGLVPEFGGEYGTTVTGYETEREITGISLRVTPQINLDTGEIIMFICPRVSEATLSSIQPTVPLEGQTDYQDVESRATKSLVKVGDGETVVVGGLIHIDKDKILTKIPILGDIPILGMLFRRKDETIDKERELLIFITPHIVKDISLPLAKYSSQIPSSHEQDIPSEEARLLNIEAALNRFNSTQY